MAINSRRAEVASWPCKDLITNFLKFELPSIEQTPSIRVFRQCIYTDIQLYEAYNSPCVYTRVSFRVKEPVSATEVVSLPLKTVDKDDTRRRHL